MTKKSKEFSAIKKQPITKEIADQFFATLEDNEGCMGEYAALGVTLTMFGYQDHESDVLGAMAAVLAEE